MIPTHVRRHGLVELCGGLRGMRHATIPATLRANPAAHKLPIPLVCETTPTTSAPLLNLSTGFTGHDAASIFRRID